MTTVIFLIVSLAWGLFAWKKPASAILWFPIMLPVYVLRTKVGPLPTTLLELMLLAMMIGATMSGRIVIWRTGWERTKPWRLAILLWMTATGIAILIAPDHLAALGLWRAYTLEPLFYFVLLLGTLKHKEDDYVLIRSLVMVTIGITAWAVFQFVTNIGIPHPWDVEILRRRATGPFPFPNAVSLFCAPIAALCFGLAISKTGTRRAVPMLGFTAGTIATLLAKSVGGTLAILSTVLMALIWKKRTRLITVISTCIIIITILIVPALRTPIIRNLSFQDWSGKVRLIIWHESWNMIKDRPIFGAGLGAYPEIIKPYHKATFIEIFQYPHNILLNLWSETGLPGILAFSLIVIIWLRLALTAAKDKDATHRAPTLFVLPLLAILVQGLVDVPYFKNDLAILFWIFAALI